VDSRGLEGATEVARHRTVLEPLDAGSIRASHVLSRRPEAGRMPIVVFNQPKFLVPRGARDEPGVLKVGIESLRLLFSPRKRWRGLQADGDRSSCRRSASLPGGSRR